MKLSQRLRVTARLAANRKLLCGNRRTAQKRRGAARKHQQKVKRRNENRG